MELNASLTKACLYIQYIFHLNGSCCSTMQLINEDLARKKKKVRKYHLNLKFKVVIDRHRIYNLFKFLLYRQPLGFRLKQILSLPIVC